MTLQERGEKTAGENRGKGNLFSKKNQENKKTRK